MHLLIDADPVCYAASAVHEADGEEWAIVEASSILQGYLADTQATSFKVYLSGDTNFRNEIFPEYKANRIGKPKPIHLRAVKEAVFRQWDAVLSAGCEADDLIAMAQTKDTCICSVDKDFNQVAGHHYHPGIKRNNEYIRQPGFYDVSEAEALYNLYYQILIGDTSDNIKGAPGIGPKKAENILMGCETEWDYYQSILPFFSCEEELLLNARCVYLWRKPNDLWKPPVDPSTLA